MLRESVPEKGSRRVFLQKRGVHHAVLGSQRLIIWILQREAGSLQTPQALELHHWGSGFRTPWRFLPGAGGVGLGFLGKTSPWGTRSPWVPFPIRGGGQGLCPHRDPGIAGSPDGNPAFDRQCPQGLFPWEHRAVRPVGSGAAAGSRLAVTFGTRLRPHFWSLVRVCCTTEGVGGRCLVFRVLLSQRPDLLTRMGL